MREMRGQEGKVVRVDLHLRACADFILKVNEVFTFKITLKTILTAIYFLRAGLDISKGYSS